MGFETFIHASTLSNMIISETNRLIEIKFHSGPIRPGTAALATLERLQKSHHETCNGRNVVTTLELSCLIR